MDHVYGSMRFAASEAVGFESAAIDRVAAEGASTARHGAVWWDVAALAPRSPSLRPG
jgi:hypothetical protein